MIIVHKVGLSLELWCFLEDFGFVRHFYFVLQRSQEQELLYSPCSFPCCHSNLKMIKTLPDGGLTSIQLQVIQLFFFYVRSLGISGLINKFSPAVLFPSCETHIEKTSIT